MLTRNGLTLIVLGGLATAACDTPKTEQKTDLNPAATATPPAPPQPVTNTNAQVTAQGNANAGPTPILAADPIASAVNAASVKQYPNEQKIVPPAPAKLVSTTAVVRTTSESGAQVLVVKHGIDVQEVARDKDYYLVLFPDPKDAAKQMAGWVHKDSLEGEDKTTALPATPGANAKGAASKLTCKTGEVHVTSDGDFCAVGCKDDGDCKKSGGVCDGDGKVLSAGGAISRARYCVGT